MKKALFAGSFNPPTLGHLDVIERAAKLMDKLYLGVAENTEKSKAVLSIEEKLEILKLMTKHLHHVEVVAFSGLAVDFARKHKIDVFIRSLRCAADIDWEWSMGCCNRQLSGLETVLIFGNPQYSHISSTLVREIAAFGGDLKGFVPLEIEDRIKKAFEK